MGALFSPSRIWKDHGRHACGINISGVARNRRDCPNDPVQMVSVTVERS